MKGTVAASVWPAVSLSLWSRHSDTYQSTAWVADPCPWLQQWAPDPGLADPRFPSQTSLPPSPGSHRNWFKNAGACDPSQAKEM